MNKWWLIGGVTALGLAALGISKVTKMAKTVVNLSVRVTDVHHFTFPGSNIFTKVVRFFVNVQFVNPEDTKLTVDLKQIKVYLRGNEVAYTLPKQTAFSIPARSVYDLRDTQVEIPLTKLTGLVGDLINMLLSSKEERAALQAKMLKELTFKILARANGMDFEFAVDGQGNMVKGLGVVAAFNRPLKDGKKYDHLFPQPQLTDPIVNLSGDVEDTVQLMLKMVERYAGDTKKFAQIIKGKDNYDTAKRLWTFMYNHIQYREDDENVEQLRRPARVWHDRKSGVDCDCYSNFVASVLYNLNIPFKFRITKYNGRAYFQHVYVVIPDGNKEIVIDVVMDKFNAEKAYSEKKDYLFKKSR